MTAFKVTCHAPRIHVIKEYWDPPKAGGRSTGRRAMVSSLEVGRLLVSAETGVPRRCRGPPLLRRRAPPWFGSGPWLVLGWR